MAGFSGMYVVGRAGGFMGADGVNSIDLLILVGDADRQWLEPHYFDKSIKPIGLIRSIVPAGPNDANALLDACIAFCPAYFRSCPSLPAVEAALASVERLDFHFGAKKIPAAWTQLREEARSAFREMGVWRANLVPIERA